MPVTYYKHIPSGRDKPTTVYRFFDDKEHWPELYKPGSGWVESQYLLKMRFDGEIREKDIISENEALDIIKFLEQDKAN